MLLPHSFVPSPRTLLVVCASLAVAGCSPQSIDSGYERAELAAPSSAEPDAPTDPTDPSDPADPSGPSDPGDPSDPSDPSDPVGDPLAGTPWTEDTVPRGFVFSTFNGAALPGVDVTVLGDVVATTDDQGLFMVPSAEPEEPLTLAFHLNGWATTWSTVTPMEEGLNFLNQAMSEADLQTSFDSGDGAGFTLDGTHSFTIPADSVLDDETGLPYDGDIQLTATVWENQTDLDDGGEFMASPGDGQGVTEEGAEVLLRSFGMFQLALQGEDGEALLPGPGFQVEVDLADLEGYQGNEEIPFWTLDQDQGTWQEANQGTIQNLPSGEQVWEFEPTEGLPSRSTTTNRNTTVLGPQITCNPDDVIQITQTQETGTASGYVTDPQGNPVAGANVRVVAEDLTYQQNTRSDANGEFTVNVPPQVPNPVGPNGQPLFVEVDYEVGQNPALWRSDAIPAPGINGDASFGNVQTGSQTCVAGSVIDEQGELVANMRVTTSHGGTTISDANGQFVLQAPTFQPTTIYAIPEVDSGVGFLPQRVRPAPDTPSSSASACSNAVALVAYEQSTCAVGTATFDGEPAEFVRIEAFDTRYPGAAIASTIASGGEYELTVPAGVELNVRIGAGDMVESNACASRTLPPLPASGSCANVAILECE